MTVTLHTLLFITFFTSRMALMAGVKTSFTDVLPKRLFLLNGNLRASLKHNTLRTVCIYAFLSIPPSTTVVAFFQQYIVDMWASADQTCLSYLRSNQGRLRATL